MYDLYTILENIVLFISKDVVYKIVLPLVFIFLVCDIVRYLFSKDSKKEDILEAFKAKAVGIVALIFLPVIILWFITFLGKVSGAKIQTDTSIIEKLIGDNAVVSNITDKNKDNKVP